jgi:uncharacterized secreted protein with C-terminal beta-propeller domain
MSLSAKRGVSIGALTLVALSTAPAVVGQAAGAGKSKAGSARATPFRSCAGLVDYARRQAVGLVVPERLVSPVSGPVGPDVMPLAVGAPEVKALSAPSPQAGSDYSPTNVQEAGVDEPDIVKTDGSTIFAALDDKLYAVDARKPAPGLADSVGLEGTASELLLRGDRLLVISRRYGPVPVFAARAQRRPARSAGYLADGAETLLTEVDVRDPAALEVVRTLRIEGSYVSSRLNGGTARVVIAARPGVIDALPFPGATPESLDQAKTRVMSSGIRRWVPSYRLRNRRTGRTATHRLVRCRAIRRAPAFSGLDLLTVLTIDLDKGLSPVDSDALMTEADTVYASPRNLYVATERWLDPSFAQQGIPKTTTAIHKFDTSDPERTVYRASGEVPGFLLNQFSLSEYNGFLRAASTEQPSWWNGDPSRQGESFVTVLDDQGDRLVEVGQVGGLGRGERIYAVRFIGDAGFVVTFRQIDPLYTIDLSAPRHPKAIGELEILGYSAYLHPVGNDLLIGIGQDATEQGRRLGTQISLFDTSDLRAPARLAHRTVSPGSSSEVEYDHHAFLYWPPAKLAVLPVQVFSTWPTWRDEFAGAIGYRIGRAIGIEEAGRISHDHGTSKPGNSTASVRRALVVRNRLYTVSGHGVEASSLESLSTIAWLPFG